MSLPESYSGLVTALEGRDEKDLTVEYVTGKILDEYQRRVEASATNGESSRDSEVALQSTGPSKGSHHNKSKPGFKSAKPEKDSKGRMEIRSCVYCEKPGHLKNDCRKYKLMLEAKAANEEKAKTSVETKEYVAFRVGTYANDLTGWCIDSGASNHMTNDVNFLSNIRSTKGYVNIADG